MKKAAVIFLVTVSILAAGILAVSCNSAVREELGTVVLDFGGAERAVGAGSLPVLSTVRIRAEVTSSAGRTVQEYEAGNQGNISLSLPVGERVVIKVSAYNPSGIWSGSVTHTVEPGTNAVGIKLNKNVSGLNNLLFTQTSAFPSQYNLTLYMGGKEINALKSENPYSFARDSKGRLYLRYREGDVRLVRYTSEGERDVHPENRTINFLTNDYTTGKMYGTDGNLKEINEADLSLAAVSGSPASVNNLFAVDNGRVAWLSGSSGVSGNIKINTASLTGSSHSDTLINSHIDIHHCKASEVKDIFIRGDYVYVLFTTVNESITSSDPNLYSLGGVVRYNINNLAGDHEPIGFNKNPVFENNMLQNYDYSKNFYGAVKVIGFDDENLYIADDGFEAAYVAQAEGPRIVKNRNRIAALNMETNTVSFTEESTAKWYNEWKEWRAPNTKILLWDNGNARYWTSTDGTDAFSLENKLFQNSGSERMTDVFCYDQDGNLYILWKDNSNNYKVRRFALKEDGTYDTAGVDMNSSLTNSSLPVSAIAVDISDGQNILYYAYTDGPNRHIQKYKWTTSFAGAVSGVGDISFNPPNTSVTALAANKDGVFVGVKETYKENNIDKYRLKVLKYKKADENQASPASEITLVDNAVSYTDVANPPTPIPDPNPGQDPNALCNQYQEEINDLQIVNGMLYGISSKLHRKWVELYGRYFADIFKHSSILYTIGDTAKSLPNDPLAKNEKPVDDPNKVGYGFYRFIAVKCDEAERIRLIIASDSAWGEGVASQTGNNTDRIVEVNLEDMLFREVKRSDNVFSKTFSNSGFTWE